MGGRGAWSGISARLRNYRRVKFPRQKLSNYLLNPTKSPAKAKFLKQLGYGMKNHARLVEDIKEGLKFNRARYSAPNKFGRVHFQVNVELGISKKAKVVVAFVMDKGDKAPRLETIRPYHGKRDDF